MPVPGKAVSGFYDPTESVSCAFSIAPENVACTAGYKYKLDTDEVGSWEKSPAQASQKPVLTFCILPLNTYLVALCRVENCDLLVTSLKLIHGGHMIRAKLLVFTVFTMLLFLSAAKLTAGDIGYVHCRAGEGYVYLYQSADNFQVTANLKCDQQIEIIDSQNSARVKVRTADGKEGYLPQGSIAAAVPAAHNKARRNKAPHHSAGTTRPPHHKPPNLLPRRRPPR